MLSDSALIWFLSRCICVKLNRSISSQDHNFDIYTSKVSFIKKINNKSSSLKIGPLGEGGGGGEGEGEVKVCVTVCCQCLEATTITSLRENFSFHVDPLL